MLRCLALLLALIAGAAVAEPMDRDALAALVQAPYALGDPVGEDGVHQLLNSGGAPAGYVFETEPLAPLPGFSGAPIDILVMLDLDGRFIDVRLLHHNEPIFVSGLGEKPFREFFAQYQGLSISQPMVVGTPYGDGAAGSSLVYLDGVTKATASVRIAHESLLAAARAVAQEKMAGVSAGPPARPDPAHDEALDWAALVDQGIATRLTVTNAEIDAAFAGTTWADDDPEAAEDPDAPYLDLWIVDVGPPAVARAALSPDTFDELQRFLAISPDDEPILMIETARHGLVSPDFVRNTSPDWVSATQDGLPVALRDADLLVGTAEGAPDGTAMIFRTDRRLGFDPTRPLEITVSAVREHGMFRPEIGVQPMTVEHVSPDRFFLRPEAPRTASPVEAAVLARRTDLAILGAGLVLLFVLLGPLMRRTAAHPLYDPFRLAVLAGVVVFVGWWGQGQLSIVTVLGVLRAGVEGTGLAFLLYDPFSLLVWAAAILGFVLWGRGLFCGWLCPFGAMQELAARLGRLLRLPQVEPSPRWDARLKMVKYAVLAALVGIAVLAPAHIEAASEVEPFKTAVTTFFLRDWPYVAYAVGLLLWSMVTFKGFCRYVCPLGAVMAIGGLVRGRDWIPRRVECGTPCQLCRVRCPYGSIGKSGRIDYSECFQCLDCVTIHDDPSVCVPLVLAGRDRKRRPSPAPTGVPAE